MCAMAAVNEAARLKERGNQAFKARQFDRADGYYSQALRALDPAPPGDGGAAESACTLHVNRAAARLRVEDYIGALEDSDAALALDNKRGKAWYRKAAALQGLELWPAALAAAEQCLACSAEGPARKEVEALLGTLREQAARGQPPAPGPSPLARPPVTRACLLPPFSAGPWEYIPSPDGINENLLILLHGLGDSPAAFARLARQMQLPQTAALSLGGPMEVPFSDGGRSWYTVFDDNFELIQGRPGEMRRLASLEATLDALQRLLRALRQRCGWQPRSVHLLGFSQGGTTALELALRCAVGQHNVGSCVAISAGLLEERLAPPFNTAYSRPRSWAGSGAAAAAAGTVSAGDRRSPGMGSSGVSPPRAPHATPVLITHGAADAVVPRTVVEHSMQFMRSVPGLGDVALSSIPGKGHGMVQGKSEMETLMQFWSRHLSRRPTAADGLPSGGDGELLEVRPGQVSIQQVAAEGEEE